MSPTLPDIDFRQIRPHGLPASPSNGFEELTSILLVQGLVEWPDGVRFQRFGNPDGGREGRGELPNGDVWAWQAKYLFEFESSAAAQITSSVRRVLDTEPALTRYFIALPIDLPAGDTADRSSAQTRWDEKVSEWKKLADEKGMNVDFVFIGAHELLTALTESRHEGRARYWFDATTMTSEWQGRRLNEAIAKADCRYTPRVHVEVQTARVLDAVGRTDSYVERWQNVLAELRTSRRWEWRATDGMSDVFDDVIARSETALDEVDESLELMIKAARSNTDLPEIGPRLHDGLDAVRQVDDLLHEHSLTKDRHFVGDAASLYSNVRSAVGALRSAEQLARSGATRAARDRVLLLTGRAGVGKTHLFCDVAARRIEAGQPTILLLGQDFDGRSPLTQLGGLTQLGDSVDDVFAVLDATAEAAACTGLVMIDALNESERADLWGGDIQAMITAVHRHPNIALVFSCRTEFVEAVVGDHLAKVEHSGFAEATEAAVHRFANEYGLEPPTFPVLNPEFENPLFLKLTCETLTTLGEQRFRLGETGLTAICAGFLEAVNKRLAEPSRCDYDEQSNPVARTVTELALAGQGPLARDVVKDITENALPHRTWSRSLLRGLLSEGVLIEIGDGRIAFGYQRLGDVVRASAIAERSVEEVSAWAHELGEGLWRHRGVLGALGVIVPERHGAEVVDLFADAEGRVPQAVIDSFVESLPLRSPESISDRSVEIVQRLLDYDTRSEEILDLLIRVACVPGHPLNAQWLHAHLAGCTLPDRDRSWSTWLVGAMDFEDGRGIRRLVEWAWPDDLGDRSAIPHDVAFLATLTLGWFLTTTDRSVRDQATKAIVSVAERAPAGFGDALVRFRGTDDPYVIERLCAAACGVVLRSGDAEGVLVVADRVQELVSDEWPLHLMTRDYIRRVFDKARSLGWSGSDAQPPEAEWPVTTRTVEEIEALAGPPDYNHASIWHSLTGMGDFGRYVLQPALRDLVSDNNQTLEHEAERAVFDRVLALGWTPERFREIDRETSGLRDGLVERVGKKYQWIGLNEVLGRISDHHGIAPSWGTSRPRPYEYVEQLMWRDIDPSVLIRKPAPGVAADIPWFSPVAARFPHEIVDDYPDEMTGVPDPLDLIAVSNSADERWLVLVSNPNWQQPQPPEIRALDAPRLYVWLQVHSYLVPVTEVTALREWAHNKDWLGHWMPQFAEPSNVLLGAHPDDPQWSAADGSVEWWDGWTGDPKPADLRLIGARYSGTGSSRDASAQEETLGYVPSRQLFEALGLSRGVDFAWRNTSGLVLQDPSVVTGGPGTLALRRDQVSQLHDVGHTVFWTVLIGIELHHSDHRVPGDDYRWVSASASYVLNGDQVERVSASAARYRPGPTTESQINWETKNSDG